MVYYHFLFSLSGSFKKEESSLLCKVYHGFSSLRPFLSEFPFTGLKFWGMKPERAPPALLICQIFFPGPYMENRNEKYILVGIMCIPPCFYLFLIYSSKFFLHLNETGCSTTLLCFLFTSPTHGLIFPNKSEDKLSVLLPLPHIFLLFVSLIFLIFLSISAPL